MHITKLFTQTVLASCLCTLSAGSFADDAHHVGSVTPHPTALSENNHSNMMFSDNKHSATAQIHANHNDTPQMNHSDMRQPQQFEFNHKGDHHQHDDHRKEHGAQIYTVTTVDNAWLLNKDGDGTLKSEIETRVGSDENKLFFKAHRDQHESDNAEYEFKALYSRMLSDFWDAQIGARYRVEKYERHQQRTDTEESLDAVLGIHGMAPYFFETDAYLYVGENSYTGLSLDTERDFLLTQRWILQPYLNVDVVFSDDSKYAKKSGLSAVKTGVETRYEFTKNVMPYLDIGYKYSKGKDATAWQIRSESEKGWQYGLGLRLKF